MNDVVIRAENIYKEYRLGTIGYGTLRQDFQSWWARIVGKEDPNAIISRNPTANDNAKDRFLALNDVSFEINRGEVVGIIGRNGAGKSTLLKIISRVTAPTAGLIKIKGRVASLLEVGTGFHPELTGRENVYLNGAILGMTKKEIGKKFDEIVDFSEVEKFIDTPVKRYSSGMYVRLAFAVAAHLEPEILIVDEVLAVGDFQFQKKCLGKMQDVGREGRTVLFVSHNIGAISQLCTRGIILNKGKLAFSGNVQDAVTYYQAKSIAQTNPFRDLRQNTAHSGKREIGTLAFISIQDENGQDTNIIPINGKIQISVGVEYHESTKKPEIGFCIMTVTGQKISHVSSTSYGFVRSVEKGLYVYKCSFNAIFIPGSYVVSLWLKKSEGQTSSGSDDFVENAISFEIIPTEVNNVLPYFGYCGPGEIFMPTDWDYVKDMGDI